MSYVHQLSTLNPTQSVSISIVSGKIHVFTAVPFTGASPLTRTLNTCVFFQPTKTSGTKKNTIVNETPKISYNLDNASEKENYILHTNVYIYLACIHKYMYTYIIYNIYININININIYIHTRMCIYIYSGCGCVMTWCFSRQRLQKYTNHSPNSHLPTLFFGKKPDLLNHMNILKSS